MRLLHFAHRGEAQSFIGNLQLTKIQDLPINLYGNDELLLLYSGEGIYATLEEVSFVLARFPNISEIINYGICGILDTNKAQLDQIYSIKSVYCHTQAGPQFQSFHTKGELDLVTAGSRVTSKEYALQLVPLGQLVDRELWAVARAAKLANVPFKSFKLTSDIAGDTNCMDIKNRAIEFSDKMLAHFQQLIPDSTQKQSHVTDAFEQLNFYCSRQQKIILNKLLHALELKYAESPQQILERVDMASLNELEINDKLRTSVLIEKLQNLLNPLRKKVDQKLRCFANPLTSIGALVSFDPSLEKKEFSLQMKINHQTNIEKLKLSLQQINFDDFNGIMEGNLDD